MGKYDRELEIVYDAARSLGSAGVETLIKEDGGLHPDEFKRLLYLVQGRRVEIRAASKTIAGKRGR